MTEPTEPIQLQTQDLQRWQTKLSACSSPFCSTMEDYEAENKALWFQVIKAPIRKTKHWCRKTTGMHVNDRADNSNIIAAIALTWTMTITLSACYNVKDQRHQTGDQRKQTEAWDSHKLQLPWLSCIWWGFQAWDSLQDSTDNSSIDKVETSLEWQERFSQFQDTTDVLPCHIHFPVCLWIMDPHGRAA